MKKLHILDQARRGLFLTATALLLIGGPAMGADNQLENHRIQWTGSTPVKSHTGLLTPKQFDISITDDGVIESLNVVLDMVNINVTDLEGKSRDKLINHLRSEDFFYSEKYPIASFALENLQDGHLHGSITIRGITEHISIPVTVKGSAERDWIISGTFTFNRQDFDVNYQSGGLLGIAKDKIIRDEIELDIELVVARK